MTQLTYPNLPLPLADLHLPPEPGIWPLAWGWWLVIISNVLILSISIYSIWRYRRRHLAQKQALQRLDDCKSIGQLNALLKQAALSYFPREQVASLTGVQWLKFLDSFLKRPLFVPQQELWLTGSFSRATVSAKQLRLSKKIAKKWLLKALPPKQTSLQERALAHTQSLKQKLPPTLRFTTLTKSKEARDV
ncbi:MAG: DUF4381 domain-containing protein [Vibrionaceae bacterium]